MFSPLLFTTIGNAEKLNSEKRYVFFINHHNVFTCSFIILSYVFLDEYNVAINS